MSDIGYVYVTKENRFGIDFRNFHFEIMPCDRLTEIIEVIEFNNQTTFLLLNTNYGEEFFYLSDLVDDMKVIVPMNVKQLFSHCKKFQIKRISENKKSTSTEKLSDEAFMILDNLACFRTFYDETKILRVVDLNNLKNIAEYCWSPRYNHFNLMHSTFSEGKRKYEMLFLVERNSNLIWQKLNGR